MGDDGRGIARVTMEGTYGPMHTSPRGFKNYRRQVMSP
jgi:hypothetical protein